MPHLLYRAGRYYYNRRVPKKLRDFDPREVIRISLETDSPSEAERKSVIVHEQIEAYWKNLVSAGERYTGKSFRMAIEFARLLGFSYQGNTELAKPDTSLGELVHRYREVSKTGYNPYYAEALLGGPAPPGIRASEMLNRFWDITKDRIMHKTPDQHRKWKNPRIRAVKNFIRVVGDKAITEIGREDIVAFRDWWIGRVEDEKKDISTANKDLIHLKNIMETVAENDRLPVDTGYLFRKITS